MSAALPSSRLIKPSLFSATKGLDTAAQGLPSEKCEALRQAVSAIEFHLETLARVRRRSIEPRFQRRATEIEERFKDVLDRASALKVGAASGTIPTGALRELGAAVIDLANDEIDLVLEQIRT